MAEEVNRSKTQSFFISVVIVLALEFVLFPALRYLPVPLRTMAWGLCLIAGTQGLGSAARWVGLPGEEFNPALSLALGLCVWIELGGFLMACRWVSPMVLSTVNAMGMAVAIQETWRHRARMDGRLITIASLLLLPGLLDVAISPRQTWDAVSAYFPYASEILHAGTLSEPFGFRSIASYGGQSFLHALVLVHVPIMDLGFLEKALLPAIGSLIWLFQFSTLSWKGRLTGLLLIVYLNDKMVIGGDSSIFSGIIAFSALWLVVTRMNQSAISESRQAFLLSMVLAAIVALRPTYLLAAVVWEGLYIIDYGRQSGVHRGITLTWKTGAWSVLFLFPWVWMSTNTFGTPLYPLFNGHTNPEWANLVTAHSITDYLIFNWKVWTSSNLLYGRLLWAIVLLGCLVPVGQFRRLGKPFLVSGLVVLGVMGWKAAYFAPIDFQRYTLAFTAPIFLFCIQAACSSELSFSSLRRFWPNALAFSCALMILIPSVFSLAEKYIELRYLAFEGLRHPYDPYASWPPVYDRLQKSVPPGDKIIALLDYPVFLDYARNPIDHLDIAGGVSLPPGIETMHTPAQMAGYFIQHGYHWLAMESLRKRLGSYSIPSWEKRTVVRWDTAWNRPEAGAIWHIIGKTTVSVLSVAAEIPSACPAVFNERGLSMVDLDHCQFNP